MNEPRTIISKNLGLDGIVRDIPITITERQLTKERREVELKELRATLDVDIHKGYEVFTKKEKTATGGLLITTRTLYTKGNE